MTQRRSGAGRSRSASSRLAAAGAVLAAVALLAFGYTQGWLGAGGGGGIDAGPGERLQAEVVRVVDGDTALVELDGTEERVRYIGIDAPESVAPGEPVECLGPQAARYNARIVEGRQVELEIGVEPRDHYGRLLAHVRLGDLLVSAELVRAGLAETLTIPPNDRLAEALERLERAAARSGIGLWRACG